MNNTIFRFLPELQGNEMTYVSSLTQGMDERQLATFAGIYRARRKDPQMILLLALLGFLALPAYTVS